MQQSLSSAKVEGGRKHYQEKKAYKKGVTNKIFSYRFFKIYSLKTHLVGVFLDSAQSQTLKNQINVAITNASWYISAD